MTSVTETLGSSKSSKSMILEEQSGKHNTMRQEEHYAAIAKKVSTSILQIRRDFTEIFSYGAKYLDAAGRKFDQPTHYARKIMELTRIR